MPARFCNFARTLGELCVSSTITGVAARSKTTPIHFSTLAKLDEPLVRFLPCFKSSINSGTEPILTSTTGLLRLFPVKLPKSNCC